MNVFLYWFKGSVGNIYYPTITVDAVTQQTGIAVVPLITSPFLNCDVALKVHIRSAKTFGKRCGRGSFQITKMTRSHRDLAFKYFPVAWLGHFSLGMTYGFLGPIQPFLAR